MKIIEPFPFQSSNSQEALTAIREKGIACLSAGTGTGKTVMAGIIAESLLKDYSLDIGIQACPSILYVTKGTVIPSTREKLLAYFDIPKEQISFTSYSALRSKEGEMHLSKEKRIDIREGVLTENEDNKERAWVFRWKNKICSPRLIIFDEAHCKNRVGSLQSEACMAMTDLAVEDLSLKALLPHKSGTQFLFMSATSWTKAIHMEMEVRILNKIPLLENAPAKWSKQGRAMLSQITGGINPSDISFTGLNRCLKYLDAHNVRVVVPTITTKYKRKQKVKLIPFSYDWQAEKYRKVMLDYENECRELSKSPATKRRILVEMIKRNARAEELRWPELSNKAHNAVVEGYQAAIVCGYQMTIARVLIDLYKKGYRRNDISLIWGGSELFGPFENRLSDEERHDLFKRALLGEEFTEKEISDAVKQIRQDHKFLSEEDLEILGELGAGPQHGSHTEEVNNYQSGKTKIVLLTYKAGSVGIDLNHSCEYYAIRSDRYIVKNGKCPDFTVFDRTEGRNLTTNELPRPRLALLGPCMNPVEFLQGIGRFHRINSVSDTIFEILFFRGTAEEHSARILGPKLVNLKAVTKSTEAWTDLTRHASFVGSGLKVGGEEETITEQTSDADEYDDESD